jgi:hypothetical protein
MAEFSAYFWSYDRNLIHWLVFDITRHPFPGTDAISPNVMVGGHYHICCCQRSWNMWTVLQIAPQLSFVVLFYLFLGLWFLFFMVADGCGFFWPDLKYPLP